MRAIIIEEERFTEFCRLMKEKESTARESNTPEMQGWDRQIWQAALDSARREFHYEFVRWAQSHGASCTK